MHLKQDEMRTRRWPLTALSIVVAVMASVSGTAAESLRIGGSSTALGTMRELAQELPNTNGEVQILSNLSSSGGIKALLAGVVDIAVSSRPLKQEEAAQGLKAIAYGTTAFVFVAAPGTEVDNLNLPDLAAIYDGRVQSWRDGQRIRLVLNPPKDSDNDLIRAMSPELQIAIDHALSVEGMVFQPTDSAMADTVEHSPGGLGTSSLPLVLADHPSLKVLSLGGVVPNVDTVADKRYPYAKTFYLVVRRDAGGMVGRFVELVCSEQGRKVLVRFGYVPACTAAVP